ncbi:hypothetical protein DPM33_25665 [Mesorhizobium hawassense]|uniref:Uncharacterized protein n=1 Tax=Mesorhizobium hawassense TaxID=1209954 RepID=A0A330HFK5_9HYPH|nr:hypothetical protein [Mesorhizobium hawassense]RAZ87516.1 hypothetical protein DPM33_25665 [Mesorhizobium hawassense]
MTHRDIVTIDGGSAEYWRQRKQAFRLIHEAEWALSRLTREPMYLHGGYDENGDVIPIENLGPYDDMEDAVRAIEANETAVSILVAQRRTKIGDYELKAVIRELKDPDRG